MEKTRFHIGMENLKKIDGKGGEAPHFCHKPCPMWKEHQL